MISRTATCALSSGTKVAHGSVAFHNYRSTNNRMISEPVEKLDGGRLAAWIRGHFLPRASGVKGAPIKWA